MTRHTRNLSETMYTLHGKKRNQGRLIRIGGERALGYFEGGKMVGYTTLEEINRMSYTKELPEYKLDY